jgi:ribose transport system substrate-binding protein
MSILKNLRRRWIAILASMMTIAALSAGCTTTSSGGGAAGGQQPIKKEDLVLVLSVINLTNPYMASMIEGAEAMSAELGVPLKIVNSNGSSQTEISQIQAILAEGKKVALVVNTVASSDAPPIVNAVKAAGGYVVIWWNKPDDFEPKNVGDNFVAFQKHPGVASGQCTGKGLAEAMGGKGNIVAFPGVLDSTTSQTRVAGLKDSLKAFPDVKIIEEQPGNWDPNVAFKVMQGHIAKHGDQINGVWAADDAMMLGAIEAVRKAGMENKVKFASDGVYPPTIKLMKEGFGNDAIVYETFHRGYMASSIGLLTAYRAATGEIKVADLPPEKRHSLFKIQCVTPQTLDQFTKYDADIPGWIDTLMQNGPWDTEPVPLEGAGPEQVPGT